MPMTTDEMEGDENDVAPYDEIVAGLEAARSRADTPQMVGFRRFFSGLGAAHFSADEFMVLGPSNSGGGRCHGKNEMPPEDLWENVAPLVRAMDAIRERMGHAVMITNCYRAPAYNSCVGGVSSSQHMRFRACDFVCKAGSSADWASVAREVRGAGVFLGGIGLYRTFVHVDVRGSQADWDNR